MYKRREYGTTDRSHLLPSQEESHLRNNSTYSTYSVFWEILGIPTLQSIVPYQIKPLCLLLKFDRF